MFFNLNYHFGSWIMWLRNRKIEDKEKLKQFIGVKEVKESVIYTLE